MGKSHKWAEVIKAKADGKVVQYQGFDEKWYQMDDDDFDFTSQSKYRIKPEPVYPKTRMSDHELSVAYHGMNEPGIGFRILANVAIRRAIEDGDVILPSKE